MRRLLALLVFAYIINPIQAQNSFSFNCAKDVTIECSTPCISLNTTIPDIHVSTASYVVNQSSALSCFRGYVSPAAPGPSANLDIDDRYSSVLNIRFPFSFYGITYNQLIASTNGFLSFDISKAGTISHFGILRNGNNLNATSGTPEDLPSALYDKALIMGPYHDLDPNNAVAAYQIKYEVIGTAPYRKWILTYNNVPLYTKVCLNLYGNTQQIVLYETLGIVEIFVYDKEICLSWNNGSTMIGMQDFNKTSAIMAPGRQASSPPWGSKAMNESWRFVPASGASLFKKVELQTLSGAFVSTGNTTSLANNLIGVNFPNVCPPPAGGTYLVKYFYTNPNDPASDILGIDTINISRGGDPFTANVISAACGAGSKGKIIVTNPVGATFEYSIDGINWQASNVFNLPVGTYTVRARAIGSNCISSKIISMSQDMLDASIHTILAPCPGPLTGSIEIFPLHGTAPYLYSLNGGAFQVSNIFTNLSAGTYTVLVNDAAGCSFSADVSIASSNLAGIAVTNTVCDKAGSGTITVTPKFGVGPYTYSINGTTFQTSNIFTGLMAGIYNITVKDATSCSYTFDATIIADALISASIDMTMLKCFGNNNGSIIVHPISGIRPYKFALDANPFQSDSLFKNLSGGNFVLHIKDSAGCVKDTVVTVVQPNPVNGSTIIFPASTCLSSDGQITIKVNTGIAPYMFSIDNGSTYQPSNTFINVQAGAFNIIIKDSNNCKLKITDTVWAIDNKIIVNAGADNTICFGTSVMLSVNTNSPANNFSWSPSTSLNFAATPTPMASPLDTTTYIVIAKSAVCVGTDTVTINVLHKPVANAGRDTIICTNTFATLHGTASNVSGNVKYLWIPSNDISNPDSATTIVRPKDIRANAYILQVSDAYGCNFKVYDGVIVTMNPPVAAFAGNDTIASIGIPHQLFGSGGVQYLWSPANVLDNPFAQNPMAILNNDTKFNLVVKDTLGCVGTSSVLVKVYKGVTYYIPNAFTPNNDGLNDVFRAIAPGIQQTNYFRIFNRWGKLMFETHDATKGWNGTYLGAQQPSAVYVWVIKGLDVSGKIVELKGTVTLIR